MVVVHGRGYTGSAVAVLHLKVWVAVQATWAEVLCSTRLLLLAEAIGEHAITHVLPILHQTTFASKLL